MIAFSRQVVGSRGQSPRPVLIVVPQPMTRQTADSPSVSAGRTDISGLIENQVARKQQELAMLQSALGRCGLISFKENNEE